MARILLSLGMSLKDTLADRLPPTQVQNRSYASIAYARNALFRGGLRRGCLFAHILNRALYHIWQEENWMIGKQLVTYTFKSKEPTVIYYI